MWYENAYQTLMAGFTTIQSPGNPVDRDIRDWINEGRVPGPRILTSIHQIFDNSGTPEQIRALIDRDRVKRERTSSRSSRAGASGTAVHRR